MTARKYVPNPPCADKILELNMPALEASVGPEMLPLRSYVDPGWKEFGCGGFGCVYRTRTPGVVFKLTTDASEAAFVTACMQKHLRWHPAMVRYHGVCRLEGKVKEQLVLGSEPFGLWREEAFGIDAVGKAPNPLYAFRDSATAACNYVLASKNMKALLAGAAILKRDPGAEVPRDVTQFHYWVDRCERLAEELRQDPSGWATIGDALSYYMSHDMLLADVHAKNVAFVRRGAEDALAIIDPGVMVPLKKDVAAVEVPTVAEQFQLPAMRANRRRR